MANLRHMFPALVLVLALSGLIELAAIRGRVDMWRDDIILYRELEVITDFSVGICYDRVAELALPDSEAPAATQRRWTGRRKPVQTGAFVELLAPVRG